MHRYSWKTSPPAGSKRTSSMVQNAMPKRENIRFCFCTSFGGCCHFNPLCRRHAWLTTARHAIERSNLGKVSYHWLAPIFQNLGTEPAISHACGSCPWRGALAPLQLLRAHCFPLDIVTHMRFFFCLSPPQTPLSFSKTISMCTAPLTKSPRGMVYTAHSKSRHGLESKLTNQPTFYLLSEFEWLAADG